MRQRSGGKNRLLLYITGNHCNKVEGCLGFRFDFWGLGSMWFNKVVQICPKPTKILLMFGTISPVLIMISTKKLVCCVLFLLFFLFLSFSLLDSIYLILTCRCLVYVMYSFYCVSKWYLSTPHMCRAPPVWNFFLLTSGEIYSTQIYLRYMVQAGKADEFSSCNSL